MESVEIDWTYDGLLCGSLNDSSTNVIFVVEGGGVTESNPWLGQNKNCESLQQPAGCLAWGFVQGWVELL